MIESLYYNSSSCAWDILDLQSSQSCFFLQRHCLTPIVAHHKHRGQRWIFEFRKFSKSKPRPKKIFALTGHIELRPRLDLLVHFEPKPFRTSDKKKRASGVTSERYAVRVHVHNYVGTELNINHVVDRIPLARRGGRGPRPSFPDL